MIQFSDKHREADVRAMWKMCFGDSDEFIELFFGSMYKHENTLLYFVDNKPVASLQMLPYSFTFYKQEIPIYYLAGLCTLPEYRGLGYMSELMLHSYKVMQLRGIPLAILIPANAELYHFYEKFGFTKVFESNNKQIPLADILKRHGDDVEKAYTEFDALYREKDFTVQKSFEDFKTIAQEYINSGYPPKGNLAGMARIIDAHLLLELYAKQNTDKSFFAKIFDPIIKENNQIFMLREGEIEINTEIIVLTQLLFGFRISQFESKFRTLFNEHHPVINLMLE